METKIPWFRAFAGRHIGRIRRSDWPPPSADYWDTWRRTFAKYDISEATAEKASLALAEQPPKFLDHQLADFLSKAKAIQASEPRPHFVSTTSDQSSSQFNTAAESEWGRMDDFARDYWRALAVARMPFLASSSRTRDLIAMAWSHDPSLIVGGPGRKYGDPDDGSECDHVERPAELEPSRLPPSKAEIRQMAREGRVTELQAAITPQQAVNGQESAP